MVTDSRLTDDRLASIEQGARERHTLMDRVIIELVEEVRRLRGVVAGGATDSCERTDVDHPPESA